MTTEFLKSMKTSTIINSFVAVLATSGMLNAQLNCGSDQYNRDLKSIHPTEVQQAQNQLDNEKNYLIQHGEGRTNATYVIPVVFHIVHDYGIENISDAQILDQVAILNRDYAKLNADTSVIIPQFQAIASAIDIEFRLATIDPDGNCTNGIDRIASKLTNNGDDGSKLNPWPRKKYLNVWVVKTIGASGVAGYAYQPASVVGLGAPVDGIIILHDYIGSIGTSNVNQSRALTHEIGHYLDLSHPWGNTNSPGVACGDDGIPDTPQTKGWDHCPTPAQAIVCDTVGPGTIENYQNYMDYSYCSVMFTHDQMLAMHAALNSNVSDRNHLSTTANLIATGTYTLTASNCKPIADFHSNHAMICEGGNMQFFDNSSNGTVTSRVWSFPGGTPSTSTAASPTVTYNTGGQYPVTLTVTNSQGSDSITKAGYVIVGVGYGEQIGPISEGFDNPAGLVGGWYVVNYGQDPIYWHQTPAAASLGAGSVVLDNYNNTTGQIDELISPLYDLQYMTGITMNFKVAFASQVQDTGFITEKLRVLASTNCGQSWSQLTIKKGSTLISAGLVPEYFIPAANNPLLWKTITLNIGSTYAVSRVRFKFEWTGGKYGNEFYIDDLNITGTNVGVNEFSSVSYFDLFPNPSQDNSSIQFNMKENNQVKITMTDLDGRIVREIANENYTVGEHTVAFSTADLATGLYLVTVDDGKTKQVKKLAVTH